MKINSYVIGKATVNGSEIKIEGETYKTTPRFQKTLEKLNLDGETAIFYLYKGEIDGVELNGVRIAKDVEFPRFKEEGTYKADVALMIGYACNLKSDAKPLTFSVRTRLPYQKGAEKDEYGFYSIKVWDDLKDRVLSDLAVSEGERGPKVYVAAKISDYKGRPQYTLLDFGVVPPTEK